MREITKDQEGLHKIYDKIKNGVQIIEMSLNSKLTEKKLLCPSKFASEILCRAVGKEATALAQKDGVTLDTVGFDYYYYKGDIFIVVIKNIDEELAGIFTLERREAITLVEDMVKIKNIDFYVPDNAVIDENGTTAKAIDEKFFIFVTGKHQWVTDFNGGVMMI